MDREEFQKAYGKLVAKAWEDDEFKAKLLVDPMAVFKENDITLPPGLEVKIVENTDTVVNFILPPAPTGDLSDDQLNVVEGGAASLTTWLKGCLG